MKVTNAIQARAILAEVARRKQEGERNKTRMASSELSTRDIEFFKANTHEKQWALLNDPAKLLALLCPRRTGKTRCSMFKALWVSKQYPRSDIAYVVPSSKEHAKRLFWRPLEKMNQDFSLGLEFKVGEHRVVTREGTNIYVFGAKNKESPNVLRGNAWSLAILDECKDFGAHFEQIIVEAVVPALEDYNGTLMLEGTPGEVLEGLFFRITQPAEAPTGWSVHKWIKTDNPFLPEEARDLAQVEKREYKPFGLTCNSPKFRREQLAEWCTDETERAYHYDPDRNAWKPKMVPGPDGHDVPTEVYELPQGHMWLYCLGLDLGERDANAFVVGAFSPTCTKLFIVHEYARARMSIDEIADHTRGLIHEFGSFASMVADTGGYGRGVVTELQTRHSLPFESADKTGNKIGNIALMNSDFLAGKIQAKDNGPLANEWKRLTRRIRAHDSKVLLTHSDLGDAALYMWRASKHFASTDSPEAIIEGTEQYYIKLEQEATQRALKKRKQAQAWLNGALSDGN